MPKSIEKEIVEIVSKLTKLPKEKCALDAHFKKDLNIDSFVVLEMVFAVENKFKITLPEDELNNVFTLKDFIDLTEKVMEKSNA